MPDAERLSPQMTATEQTSSAAAAEPLQRVFSARQPDQLLHIIVNANAESSRRVDLTPADEALQMSVIPLGAGRVVKPHQHIARVLPAEERMVQESWIVVRGSIEVQLFDLDRTLLQSAVLVAGWLLVTLRGGHSLKAVSEGTVILECKPGPYLGRDYEPFQ